MWVHRYVSFLISDCEQMLIKLYLIYLIWMQVSQHSAWQLLTGFPNLSFGICFCKEQKQRVCLIPSLKKSLLPMETWFNGILLRNLQHSSHITLGHWTRFAISSPIKTKMSVKLDSCEPHAGGNCWIVPTVYGYI